MTDNLTRAMQAFDRVVLERSSALAGTVLDAGSQLMLAEPEPAVMPWVRWREVLPDYVVHSYDIESQAVDVDGDTAVVLSRVRMQASVLGQDRSGTFVISDVWRRREDGWRVWRRHSTPATAGVLPGSGT